MGVRVQVGGGWALRSVTIGVLSWAMDLAGEVWSSGAFRSGPDSEGPETPEVFVSPSLPPSSWSHPLLLLLPLPPSRGCG